MEQPEGFEENLAVDMVCQLQKGLYGMKQSGRIWNQTLDKTMLSWNFNKLCSELYLYYCKDSNRTVITAIQVDDFSYVSSSKKVPLPLKPTYVPNGSSLILVILNLWLVSLSNRIFLSPLPPSHKLHSLTKYTNNSPHCLVCPQKLPLLPCSLTITSTNLPVLYPSLSNNNSHNFPTTLLLDPSCISPLAPRLIYHMQLASYPSFSTAMTSHTSIPPCAPFFTFTLPSTSSSPLVQRTLSP